MELTRELIIVLVPLAILQYGFVAWCIFKILKDGVANLNKSIWMFICIIFGITGGILFLLVGRNTNGHDYN